MAAGVDAVSLKNVGVDEDGAIDTLLLLHHGVGVVPVGPRLPEGESERQAFPCANGGCGEVGERSMVHRLWSIDFPSKLHSPIHFK